MVLLDEFKDFEKILRDITKLDNKKAFQTWSNQIGRALSGGLGSIGGALFFEGIATSLQLELLMQSALSPDVQTMTKTTTKLGCVLSESRNCAGRGRLLWDKPNNPGKLLLHVHGETQKILKRGNIETRRWTFNQRPVVRGWLRFFEDLNNQIEDIVLSGTRCPGQSEKWCRRTVNELGTVCVKKEFRDFK